MGQQSSALIPEAPPTNRFGSWLRRAIPTAAVLALLSGLAIWGHATEWEFGFHRKIDDNDAKEASLPLATIRFESRVGKTSHSSGSVQSMSLVFPSTDTVDKAGIDVAPAWSMAMTESLNGSGELSFDPNRVARISARAPGTVWRVLKKVGASVQAGEVIALIDAADVGKAKGELQQALVQVRLRQKALSDLRLAGTAVNQRQQREAEASLREAEVKLVSAEQSLVNLGLAVKASEFASVSLEEVVSRMRGIGVPTGVGFDATNGTANLLPVRVPFAGKLLSVDVVAGEVVESGRLVATVIDPKQLWLTLHIPQDSVKRIALDQSVKFRPDGQLEEVTGRVSWIGTTADEVTRTVPVRATLANDKGLLRSSTLGRGWVAVRENPKAIVVPRESVQSFRGLQIVFVRHPDYLKPEGSKEFAVRAVQVGTNDGTNTEILSGLAANEIVAAKGANVLLGELGRLTQTKFERQ